MTNRSLGTGASRQNAGSLPIAPGQTTQWLRPRRTKSPAAYLLRNFLAIDFFVIDFLVIALASAFVTTGNAAPPKTVALANAPLYAAPTDKPGMVLALSVEYPTVGAQYQGGSPDTSYTTGSEYLGYYDAESCYRYNTNPAETPVAPNTRDDYKRFDRIGLANLRRCTNTFPNTFSGNFLNWATGSAIDMHRLALSGGDRFIDTPSFTILQRAVLPNGNPACSWKNPGLFPAKVLRRNLGGSGTYAGAVPQSMINEANGADIVVANMLNRIYFGTTQSRWGSCANPSGNGLGAGSLNLDGFFYSRVQVCNADAAGNLRDVRDYDFCKKYPDGGYKPTGVIQKYSDQMRLAAFGYLLDQTPSWSGGRYGGVLRAPMKYVGKRTFDTDGYENTPGGGNPKAEWNSHTGIFTTNPDSHPMAISGVINYLNRFGRTGMYKVYDPVGELHYEALRYLQGLQPSPAAIAGTITDTMKDGFPYFSTWEDPYGDGRTSHSDYSCVKSNILVIGDVHSHDGGRLPPPSAANNIPDIDYWRSIVLKFEKAVAGTYLDGQSVSRNISNPNPPNHLITNVTNDPTRSQMIGSAYWARTHDIRGTGWTAQPDKQRPGLRVKTSFFDVNESGFQNDSMARRQFNQFFMAAKYGGFETDPANPGARPYNTQGNPFKDQNGNDNNDVWQKADDPGEAKTYHVFDPTKLSPARNLLTAFDEIFYRSSVSAHSTSGGSINTGHRLTENSISYSAKFDTGNWTGDVVAEPIDQNASHAVVMGAPLWSAAQRLDVKPPASRKIFVGPQSISPGNPGVVATEFTWTAISNELKAHLNRESPSAAADAKGADRLAYLRGDRGSEGNPFRVRGALLGDVVNSNISYSGAPSSKVSTGNGRPSAVFAGANDGMLHAFDADSGDELFAYIPGWLGPKLSALTNPDFVHNHQSYVDAPSVVAEAQVSPPAGTPEWKTVLVSGTGAGGAGVFALDVSNPANFGAGNVMWEFTRDHDPDLGQVVGAAKILKIKTTNACPGKPTACYRWFAVVGSGVNNHLPYGNNPQPDTVQPALFLLALDKPAGQAWSLGSNYFKVSLPPTITPALAATQAAGLANFSALYGADGEMTDIYMGDLHGALWRLQFAGKFPAQWTMNQLSFFHKGTTPYPLYMARDSQGKVQPIFAAPTLFAGLVRGGVETFHVVIGTGKYLEPGDLVQDTQSVYAIYDNGSTTADSSSPGRTSVITGRSRLQTGAVDTTTKRVTVNTFNWGRPLSDTDATQRAGWYFDLPVPGERIDQAGLNAGDMSVSIHSKIPAIASGTGSCSNALGGGNQYHLSIDRGAGGYVPYTLGLLGPPVLQSVGGQVTPSDSAGQRTRTTVWNRFTQTQSGIVTNGPPITTTETTGRLGWRQIFNYRRARTPSSAVGPPRR